MLDLGEVLCLGIALLVLLPSTNSQSMQGICNRAPSASLRITCQQITNWAANTRNVRPTTRTSVSSPGPAGLTVGTLTISPVASSTTATTAYECLDIACLCGFFGGTGGSNCVLANGQMLTKATRKEYRVLTDDERQRYHTAMWTIKGNGDYDTISRIHSQFITSPGAHSGPAFLPWHREFIKRIEIALRRVDPTVALPYWDSTLDNSIPSPTDSVLWGNELMGKQGSDGLVRTGAFRNWLTVDGSRIFMRDVGSIGGLLAESDITTVLGTTDFRQVLAYTAPQADCPNPAEWTALEYVHGSPHVFVGGDMLTTTTATNDPIFFNHHSMIDLIWEQWRIAQQSRSDRETMYPDDNSLCSSASHFASNTMEPFFPMVNRDGLSNQYTDNLYQFDPRPTCSRSNLGGCRSKYLFCDLSHGTPRCAAKIVVGGNCGGYTNNEDRCYLGQCSNNICAVIPTPSPTTQPPIVTTTPIGPSQETCFNEQQCCAPWASRGECSRNPTYMNVWCKASCGICRPTTYNLNTECSNRNVRCVGWANRGECRNNPSWMSENCRLSCNLCGSTRAQVCVPGGTTTTTTTTTTMPPLNNACINQHYCCIAWASRGYCTSSSQRSYMSMYCQAACSLCSGSVFGSTWNTQACSDGNANCAIWTTRGECNANRVYMWENCRRSCSACNIGMLSIRLSSCGFSRRFTAQRQPISEFRIKPHSLLVSRQPAPQPRRVTSVKSAAKGFRWPRNRNRQTITPIKKTNRTQPRVNIGERATIGKPIQKHTKPSGPTAPTGR